MDTSTPPHCLSELVPIGPVADTDLFRLPSIADVILGLATTVLFFRLLFGVCALTYRNRVNITRVSIACFCDPPLAAVRFAASKQKFASTQLPSASNTSSNRILHQPRRARN